MPMPPDTLTYAIGDIHGCAWLLDPVIEWIIVHAARHPLKHKHIVVLGDMIDRGPDSKGVLERLMTRSPNGFSLICLRGNHEDMMIRTMESGRGLALWLQNGGRNTLESYGLSNVLDLERAPPAVISRTIRNIVPETHQDFLSQTRLSWRQGDYLFVHAGIRPGLAINQQNPEDLLWIRKEFTESNADLGVTVVHGHSVLPEPTERLNAIGLDTGAVGTGRLSCVALWGDNREFFTTPGFRA